MESMQDYIVKGHVERVDAQSLSTDSTITYLPHQPVKKIVDGQLNVRIVFDASQKSETGVSLNDVLLTGPSLQNSIPRVIMRWRVYQWVFAADIQGMYRQILVAPKDRNCLRFLWRNDSAEEVQEWRLTRVVFGIASAPYLALRTIQEIIQDYGTSFPLAAKALSRETYVDDILTGGDTIDEAIEKKKQLISLLKCGQFELHKWMTNNQAVVSEENIDGQRFILAQGNSFDEVKTLGLNWNSVEDSFKYFIDLAPREKCTKRTLLSDLFKIHNPLGWIGPVIVCANIILQEIWLRNIMWDEILPADLETRWIRFRRSLPTLDTLRIPRWIGIKSKQPLYIHGFCDASLGVYGAVIYVRTSPSKQTGESTLLIAKSKVAPIKTITLPHLELCGAVLLAKLLCYVKETFEDTVIEAAWTDSSIVLAWIRGRPRSWKTFVANRVSEIHDRIGPHVWKHVPTKSNPADCLSRGLEPSEIIEHKLWWTGPDWLRSPSSEWPHQDNIDEVHLEEKNVQATNIIVTEDQENDLEVRYSSLNRLLRVTAYCLRFIRSIKVGFPQPEITKELHTKEIGEALKTWIKVIQERAFSVERSCIELGKPIPPRSIILSLNPFLDEDGLLRVGGRLRNSMLPTQQRRPIVLPRVGHIIDLIVRETHEHTVHGGGTLMLSILRRQYWILRARNVVRSCIRRCGVCRRYQHSEATQLMGDLPAARVQSSRPFTHTGVDYCGPFDINLPGNKRHLKKAYVAIFICFATKAVHLEVVMDLSSEAFIAAFRRFTARRGLCTDLYSDRGTNFVGTDQQLQYEHKIFCNQIQPTLTKELMAKGIAWHFNPPSAPHFGGLWEAGVKSFKYHLRRVMGQALLSIDEFKTAVAQIEGCLNSRPLTPVSDNPDDIDALTPGHFITAGPPLAHPEPTLLHLSPGRLARWQLTQRLVQGFWRRWSSEYLTGLQQRQKWRTKQENLKLNDLVLIKEPNLPPTRWRLARIIELHPGADGLVHVLTLRTSTSIVQRPIVQICPLLED